MEKLLVPEQSGIFKMDQLPIPLMLLLSGDTVRCIEE
jgi:hypothetical protein